MELAKELEVARLAVAPIHGSARCIGVVLSAGEPSAEPVDSFTQDLVRTLSIQAGLAIERLRATEALRNASLHDELTRLGNRRKANRRFPTLEAGDVLVAIDLDHFKQVNDTQGHAVGDAVLVSLGTFLSGSLRQGSEAFRMGGEEFLELADRALYDAKRSGRDCVVVAIDDKGSTPPGSRRRGRSSRLAQHGSRARCGGLELK